MNILQSLKLILTNLVLFRVDCVDQKDVSGGDPQENGIMLNLMDDPSSSPLASGPDNEQLGTSGASINRLLPNNMPHNNMPHSNMPNNMPHNVPNNNVVQNSNSIANSIPIV